MVGSRVCDCGLEEISFSEMQHVSGADGLIRSEAQVSTDAFQTQYLSIEGVHGPGGNGEGRSISVMMCEKGKLRAQHGRSLITFHLAVPPLDAK